MRYHTNETAPETSLWHCLGATMIMPDEECPFCGKAGTDRAGATLRTVYAISDQYSVTDGHSLIIPFRHTPDFFAMTSDERSDAFELVERLREKLLKDDSSIVGFNLGMNCGQAAGQTIMHAHIHLIPRRNGDVSDPRGGVRGVIPDRMKY
jgi:diadenosine tetraphosphate (Ap4A) HIT family hydrolase